MIFSFDPFDNLTVTETAQQLDAAGGVLNVSTSWEISAAQVGRSLPGLMQEMDAETLAQAQAIAARYP